MAARSKKKQNGSGVLPWIALLLLAVVVATFVYAHVHVVSQHTTPHICPFGKGARGTRDTNNDCDAGTFKTNARRRSTTSNELDPRIGCSSSRGCAPGRAVRADDVFIALDARTKGRGTAFAGMAKKILRAEPGAARPPVLRARRVWKGRAIPPLHLSSSARNRQAHVEHGPLGVGAVLRAGVVPVDRDLVLVPTRRGKRPSQCVASMA